MGWDGMGLSRGEVSGSSNGLALDNPFFLFPFFLLLN